MKRLAMVGGAAAFATLLAFGSSLDEFEGERGRAPQQPSGRTDGDLASATSLQVRTSPGSDGGLDRDDFGLWRTRDGCTTRQHMLIEHGSDVRTDEDCDPVSGSWRDPYSGRVITDPGELDIEHAVPVQDALRSGAADWSRDRRVEFGNDPENLLVVSSSLNQERGDSTWDEWQPPRGRCDLGRRIVEMKDKWELTVTEPELRALEATVQRCG